MPQDGRTQDRQHPAEDRTPPRRIAAGEAEPSGTGGGGGEQGGADEASDNPVMAELQSLDRGSAIAVVGHPLHAMLVHFPIALAVGTLGTDLLWWLSADEFFRRAGTWAIGGAFLSGALASLVGMAEVLLVAGIRSRGASWTHAVAALTFLAVCAANWGLRLQGGDVLPDGLLLSLLGTAMAGLAGWHGGKLIFDHGIGLMVSPRD